MSSVPRSMEPFGSPRGSSMKRSGSLPDYEQLRDLDPFKKIGRIDTQADDDKGLGENPVTGRVAAMALLPFIPLVFYSIVVLHNQGILLVYLSFLVLYYIGFVSFIITQVTMFPPWYAHRTPAQGLSTTGLPDYWQGIHHDPQYDLGLDYQDVEFDTIPATNGKLRGWWVPGLATEPEFAVVFVHGGGRDRRAWLRHTPVFYEQGYPSLLFDLSEHGVSDARGLGLAYGVREQHDVLAAVQWIVREKGITNVILCGTSVGGASVVYAAARDCSNIRGVIIENPVAHPERFISEHVGKILYVYAPNVTHMLVRGFIWLTAQLFLFRIGILFEANNSAAHKIRDIHVPVMVMHGTADEIVPLSHGKELFASANEPKFIWVAPDCWHCALYDKYPDEFRAKIHDFCDVVRAHLKKQK